LEQTIAGSSVREARRERRGDVRKGKEVRVEAVGGVKKQWG
jgi:hypothetical protein